MPAVGAGVAKFLPAVPRGRVLCQSRTAPESEAIRRPTRKRGGWP